MQHVSPSGDQGYPGTLTATVTYTLTDDDAVYINYGATTDATTIINLTNHTYFNLAGKVNATLYCIIQCPFCFSLLLSSFSLPVPFPLLQGYDPWPCSSDQWCHVHSTGQGSYLHWHFGASSWYTSRLYECHTHWEEDRRGRRLWYQLQPVGNSGDSPKRCLAQMCSCVSHDTYINIQYTEAVSSVSQLCMSYTSITWCSPIPYSYITWYCPIIPYLIPISHATVLYFHTSFLDHMWFEIFLLYIVLALAGAVVREWCHSSVTLHESLKEWPGQRKVIGCHNN